MALDPKAILARMGTMKGARTTHDSHWQEVADYIFPARQFNRSQSPGAKRGTLIFNTHPVLACEQLAGGLHGMLTSPSLRWFTLRALPHMAGDQQSQAWFEAATEAMYAQFQSARTGFNVALHETYLDIAAFGSGVIFIADKGLRGVHYQAVPLSECWYAENADRQVDTLYRCYKLPAREVLRLWPTTAPDRVRGMAEKKPDAEVEIIHATEPSRSGASRGGAAAGATQGFDTCWITGGDYLEHGRYREFPYAVARWTKRSGEVYGTGPGMNALPDVKMLNKMEETNLRGMAKLVDPPMMLPDDGFLNAPNMNPSAHNYFRAETRHLDRIGPLQTGGRPDLAFQYIEMVQERISGTFYTTWLRLPQQPNMTATEVLQRRDELLRLLGPMTSRLENELLDPGIERTFAIMMRNGLFPPPPPQLRGQGWSVEYLGPLSRAQRQADAETVMRWMASMQPLVQADPRVLQAIDTDEAARFLADRHGAPAMLVRTPAQIAAIRGAEAQQQQMQAEAATLAQGAGAAKDGASALATLAGIAGPQQ
jgi:hypothetical protein